MVKKNFSLIHQFIRFVMVGGAATFTQYVILVILVEIDLVTAPAASSIGFAISAMLNYWLNYHFTFASDASHQSAALKFAIVAATGLGLNYLLMYFLSEVLEIYYIISQIQVTFVVLLWNFFVNRAWTFRRSTASACSPDRG